MEEAPENSKKSSHSAHANGIECSRLADEAKFRQQKLIFKYSNTVVLHL
jgi:hypothetical protein